MTLVYTVSATLPDPATRDRYLAWLTSGHLAAVLAGGASMGQVVRIDEPAEPIRVQTRYEFPDRAAFDRYERLHAPALRADGGARFGPDSGVRFERTIGTLV